MGNYFPFRKDFFTNSKIWNLGLYINGITEIAIYEHFMTLKINLTRFRI